MKSKSLKYLQNKGFKLYPKNGKFNVYLNNKWYADDMTEREILKAAKNIQKPVTKPRQACKTPRPGCPCCDFPKNLVKVFDRKANRRLNKRVEIDEDMKIKKITDKQEIQKTLHNYLLNIKVQPVPFIVSIFTHEHRPGGTIFEGARPFGCVTYVEENEIVYSLTNGDSNYSSLIGWVTLSEIEYIEVFI